MHVNLRHVQFILKMTETVTDILLAFSYSRLAVHIFPQPRFSLCVAVPTDEHSLCQPLHPEVSLCGRLNVKTQELAPETLVFYWTKKEEKK